METSQPASRAYKEFFPSAGFQVLITNHGFVKEIWELQENIHESSDSESDDGGFIETAQTVKDEHTEIDNDRISDSR